MKKLTTAEFIRKAKEIHGDRYDYSKSVYAKAKDPVEIVCREHGSFWQSPDKHCARKHGCHQCAYKTRKYKKPNTTESFIARSLELHGNYYDYSRAKYTKAINEVELVCPVHGVFFQTAYKHLGGHGCRLCGDKSSAAKNAIKKEDFLLRATQKHGNKYDYTDTVIVSGEIKCSIKCKEHGFFLQTPFSHLNGSGCPDCAVSGFNPAAPGILYLAKLVKPYCTFWKVGITNNTVRKRFASDAKYIQHVETWKSDKGSKIIPIEENVLHDFAKYKLNWEEFLFPLLRHGGHTECFVHNLPYKKVAKYIESQLN